MDRPNISSFSDVLLFLKAYFEFEKTHSPEFTVRKWATRMGFASPKSLVQILKGSKQIKLREISTLLRGMDLNPRETQKFEILVLMSLAKDPIEIKILTSALQNQNSGIEKEEVSSALDPKECIEVTDEEIFSSWVDAAVISALELKSAKKDLKILKKNLLWETDADQVDRSVLRLRKNGLVSPLNDLTDKIVTTRSDRSHAGARKYYEQMNQIATLALEVPLIEREFQGFSLPTHSHQIPLYKQMIRDFRKNLSNLSSDEGNIVLQFNLQMFPLTHKIENEEASQPDPAQ